MTTLEITQGPGKFALMQSLFSDDQARFTCSDGSKLALAVHTVKRDGEVYYLIAYGDDPEDEETMYFLRYFLNGQSGKCVKYDPKEQERLPNYLYYTPDYWHIALEETPHFD